MSEYYVDSFAGEVIKKDDKDRYAPPERYYEYRKGVSDDIIIETYVASHDPLKLIDFSHLTNMSNPVGSSLINMERDAFFEQHGLTRNLVLYAYTVPPEYYDEEVGMIEESEK